MDRQTWSRMRLWDSPANVRLVPMYFQSWSSPSTGWSNPLCLLVLVLWRYTQLRLSRTPWHVILKASFSELTDWNKLNFLIFGKVKTDPNLNHYFMFPRADVFLLVCLQNRLLILDYGQLVILSVSQLFIHPVSHLESQSFSLSFSQQ